MLFDIDRKLQIIIILFICIMLGLYKYQHDSMFTEDGKIKSFGSGPNKTITPLWLVSLSIVLLIYVFYTVREDDFV